jgi:NADH dehydrogenase
VPRVPFLAGRPANVRPRVVVVGAGFAGLAAVRGLAGAPVEVLLVDARNHHLFQPLLYQVATASLSPADVAAPLRQVLARQRNADVRLGRVTAVDLVRRSVEIGEERVPYDFLVLAPGAANTWFGNDAWSEHAFALKTLDDAVRVRQRVLLTFERADQETDPERRRRLLTFAIVGAGPTGVELAGALAEMARRTLAGQFRRIDTRTTRVLVLDAAERVLPAFEPSLARHAQARLEALGVEVRLATRVRGIDAHGLDTDRGRVDAGTVIWAAGVQGAPLLQSLAVPLLADGRVEVAPDLSLPGRSEVFVVGDAAAVREGDAWVPGTAPPALQMGRHAARTVLRAVRGRARRPFRYRDRGTLAVIGRGSAVARVGTLRFSGFVAWVLWVVVHIAYLVGFRNRLVVLLQWAWAYVTDQRGARVIVDESRTTPAGTRAP